MDENTKNEPLHEIRHIKYALKHILENADAVLKVKRETAEGAFYGMSGEYTLEQAKTLIDNFLKRTVE